MRLPWLVIFISVLLWSVIEPRDYATWVLEAVPAIAGLAVLAWTRDSFPLTPLLYWLILAHCVILLVGAHYTYAEVPLFDHMGTERNNYDKLGHFAQGFVPAMIARELLIRKNVVSTAPWRNFIIVCFCLALSAFYELLEWLAAIAFGGSAQAFLGTQGYEWDTQTDMAVAFLGAVTALLTLGRLHNRQLERLRGG